MRRFLPVLALAALLLPAAPAWAHEEINPSTIPTGTPVFFSLDAANEKAVDLTGITLTAPPGLAFGEATRSPAGWTAARTDAAITWTGGHVAPQQFEQWGFEIEGADQPGRLTYKVTLGFADGTSDDVDVVVTAVAGSTPEPPEPTSTSSSSSTSTSGPAAGDKPGDDGSGSATGLAVAALALSIVALAVASRRRRDDPPTATSTSTPASTPDAGNDW
jgi:MYXO-CTERM domain-containing protein